MDFLNTWKGHPDQLLDEVLLQEINCCWCIATIRQLTAMCRRSGLLEKTESLSIQYVINGIEDYLMRPDGCIYDLESTATFLVEEGTVLDSKVPLTYKLGQKNKDFEVEVMKVKIDDLILHNLNAYGDIGLFEDDLKKFLNQHPVAVSVRAYKSFGKIVGDEIYCPLPEEYSTEADSHVMLLSGVGEKNGVEFWELQESAGLNRGVDGYIRVAMGIGAIFNFVEIRNPQKRFERRFTEEFSESNSFDKVLYKMDIMSNKAQIRMLAHMGDITDSERDIILRVLDYIKRRLVTNKIDWSTDEDAHMHVQAFLARLLGGDVGIAAEKLRTTRNRNEQVATDFRLWCRAALDTIIAKINNLQRALVEVALNNKDLKVPIQTAQCALLPHVLLTYVEQLERDARRYTDCRERLNLSPLGPWALDETGKPIDRSMIATNLHFIEPMRNRIDAVSDRDFVLEFLYSNSNTAMHLSQLGEEWVLWSLEEFGFMTLGDSVSIGSSIMPQKNRMELVRGDFPRVIGGLVTALSMCKGPPSAYNRDFQEFKETIFASTKNIVRMIDVATKSSKNVTFNQERIEERLPAGYCDTDILLSKRDAVEQIIYWKNELKMDLDVCLL